MTTKLEAELAISSISKHPKNPRHKATADDDMVASVRENGLIQPVVVAPAEPGQYVLIAGHRRLDASKAEKMPGVAYILTAANAPKTYPFPQELFFQGEIVAMVAADSEDLAYRNRMYPDGPVCLGRRDAGRNTSQALQKSRPVLTLPQHAPKPPRGRNNCGER